MNSSDLLILFNRNKATLPYAKESPTGGYFGWTKDFNIRLKSKPKDIISLDLAKEPDLFLLFVLASAWSRSGRWEMPALFVSYLIAVKKLDSMVKIKTFVDDLPKKEADLKMFSNAIYADSIKQFSFVGGTWRTTGKIRFDIFRSIKVLYKNWDYIKNSFATAGKTKDYRQFMLDIRKIQGLGYGRNKMKIKIPLILRELKIQGVYTDIPGELCCVPDSRVRKAIKEISDLQNIEFAFDSGDDESIIDGLINTSTEIYNKFGDWYDIVLFAYEDLL